MKKILIVSEKKFISKAIEKALSGEEDIVNVEIGGHIYTKDEVIRPIKNELMSAKTVALPNNIEIMKKG